MNIPESQRTRKAPLRQTRRTYIMESYKKLIKENRLIKDGYAMKRWTYLRLNDYNVNS